MAELKGYSIIECLIALCILGINIVLVFGIFDLKNNGEGQSLIYLIHEIDSLQADHSDMNSLSSRTDVKIISPCHKIYTTEIGYGRGLIYKWSQLDR